MFAATGLTGSERLAVVYKNSRYQSLKEKSKVQNVTYHEGTEGEYWYSRTLSLTSALE